MRAKFEPKQPKIRRPAPDGLSLWGQIRPACERETNRREYLRRHAEEGEETLKVLIAEMKKETAKSKAGEKATKKG